MSKSMVLRCVFSIPALFVFWAPQAAANHLINSCDQFCASACPIPAGNCVQAEGGECLVAEDLQCCSDPLVCSGTGPIVLKDGTDLDLHGNSITCGQSACQNGIELEANGSVVFNSSPEEATIVGPFVSGINCLSQNGSKIEGITVVGPIIGIANCSKAFNNVVGETQRTVFGVSYGIFTTGVQDTDEFRGNYIRDRVFGVYVDGTNKVRVKDNVIHTSDLTVTAVFSATDDVRWKVLNNVVFGTGEPTGVFNTPNKIIVAPVSTDPFIEYDGNLCDEDHSDCGTCITDGLCEPFTSPFNP